MQELLASASFPNTAQGVGHLDFSLAQTLDIRHQLSWTAGPLCRYSALLKLYSRCRAPLPTIPASFTAPAALLLPTYRPISTMKPASAASLGLARHCLIMANTSSSGAVLGTRRITFKMGDMASGIIPVFRVKSYQVSISFRIGKTPLAPNPLILASSKAPICVPGDPYTREMRLQSLPWKSDC